MTKRFNSRRVGAKAGYFCWSLLLLLMTWTTQSEFAWSDDTAAKSNTPSAGQTSITNSRSAPNSEPGESRDRERGPRKRPDVGFLATTQDVVERILERAKVTPQDVVCDLGCGDGRFVITAAKKFGCRGLGYEIDPKLVALARQRAEMLGVNDRVQIYEQDIFTVDLSQVQVVTLFLLPDLNQRLIPQLQKLPKGARVISHEFEIPGLIADREEVFVSKLDDSEHLLFYYSVPLKSAPRKNMPLKQGPE